MFIHQTRPSSSNPLTKKYRINWQHQSRVTTNRQLSSSLRDANDIQSRGEKWACNVSCFIPFGFNAKTELLWRVFYLSAHTSPGLQLDFPKLNKCRIVSCNREGKWRIVSDGLIIGVRSLLSILSDLGTGKELKSGRGEAAGLTQQKILFDARTHTHTTLCSQQPSSALWSDFLRYIACVSPVLKVTLQLCYQPLWSVLFIHSDRCVCGVGVLNGAPWRELFTAEPLRAVTHAFNLTNKSLMVFCESMEMQCQFWYLISISVTSPYV